jgi:hypothetical protein
MLELIGKYRHLVMINSIKSDVHKGRGPKLGKKRIEKLPVLGYYRSLLHFLNVPFST